MIAAARAAGAKVTFQRYDLTRDSNVWLVRWPNARDVGVALAEFAAVGVFKHHVEDWAVRGSELSGVDPLDVALYDEVTLH